MKEILFSTLKTMNRIEVKGKENLEALYCSITAIEKLIQIVSEAENDIKTEDGEMNG